MCKQYLDLIKNHKLISGALTVLLTVFGISYSVASYVIASHESMEEVIMLRQEFVAYKKEDALIQKEFDKRLTDYEREFKMTTTKLDVTLAKISTDLQFIKEQLMSRGMSK